MDIFVHHSCHTFLAFMSKQELKTLKSHLIAMYDCNSLPCYEKKLHHLKVHDKELRHNLKCIAFYKIIIN